MLIPTGAIRDWRDLQDKLADLFREMGYEVRSPHVVDMVRGRKEIDVHVPLRFCWGIPLSLPMLV